jgi:F0F1-type ATP synthase epsilon subunit
MGNNHQASETFHVIARAPFKVYYDGEALSLAAKNRIGDFSILPRHADFFSMLTQCSVEIIDEETTTTFEIERGLLTIKNNQAYLFVNV